MSALAPSRPYCHSQKLSNALAILRATELVIGFKPKSHVTQTQWAAYLEGLYRQAYASIYADSLSASPADDLAGAVESTEKSLELGAIFAEFARRFFDANGFFLMGDSAKASHELAWLYQALMLANAFGAATSLTTRVFFTLMGEMRGFREKLGGIDFRRLSSAEVELLRAPEITAVGEIAQAFDSAMQRQRDPVYPAEAEPHPHWPDHTISLGGMRFMQLSADSPRIEWSQKPALPESVMVLANGRVVLLSVFTALLNAYQKTDGLLGNWRIPRAAWVGVLVGLPDYFKSSAMLDYSDVQDAAPPLCLSLHPFSHLSHAEHQRLENYLQKEYGKTVFSLENQVFANQVLAALQAHPHAQEMVKLAASRVRNITLSLKQRVKNEVIALSHKAKAAQGQKPILLMTMGGSGSGKNSNRFYRARCAEAKFVYASLDDGRSGNDIYHVLVAAGHHADDYEAVHLWADTRRNWLCDAAREAKLNVIFDGSGIEYTNRYDAIVKSFAEAGYCTEIIAADCMLVVPEARRQEFPASAIERIIARSQNPRNHYRTLPWRVAINKHIGFPASFLAAFHDANLHRLMLVDNAGAAKTDAILAQMFEVDDAALAKVLQASAQGKNLLKTLQNSGCTLEDTIDESRLTLLHCRAGGCNRLLVITHVERMVDVLEKGQLNPNAHSPQTLTWLKRSASFLIDRLDKPEGISTVPMKKEGTASKAKSAPRSNYLRLNSGRS